MTDQRTFSISEVSSLVRGNLIGWGVVTVVFCVIPSVLLLVAIPQFTALFKGFGADLPAVTQLLLDWRLLLWVMPALALLLLGFASKSSSEKAIAWHGRLIGAFVALCCLSMIVQGVAVAALYAPILRLGPVV